MCQVFFYEKKFILKDQVTNKKLFLIPHDDYPDITDISMKKGVLWDTTTENKIAKGYNFKLS